MGARVFMTGVYLSLGAMLTVIDSWTCALRDVWTVNRPTVAVAPAAVEWPFPVPDADWPARPSYFAEGRAAGLTRRIQGWNADTPAFVMAQDRFGWPFQSMRWRYVGLQPARQTHCFRVPQFLKKHLPKHVAEMPLEPLWPGFAGNALLAAGSLWMIISGPRRLRSLIRVHQGRCDVCGYDLRGSPHLCCPECGSAARLGAKYHEAANGE